MTKFLLRLLFFLSPIVAVLILIDLNLGRMPNSDTQKRSYLENRLSSIEVLLTGSSHSFYGINPNYFSHPGFNLASVSQDFYYDFQLVHKYEPQLHNLKLVIIPISYFSLEYKISDNVESWRQFFYYRFWSIPLEKDTIVDLRKYSYISLYGQETTLKWSLNQLQINTDMNNTGWLPQDPNKDRTTTINAAAGQKRVKFHEELMKESFLAENINRLRQMIEELRSKNIKVVFITTPAFHTYTDNLTPTTYQGMQNTIKQLQKEYNVPYFNYLFDERFTIDDFFDNDHLDSRGAAQFSQILDRDIIQPLLNSQQTVLRF